jgi:hypothetical protein
MEKSYLVFIEGLHEYTITSNTKKNGDVEHTIFHSKGEQWSQPTKGTKILSIIEGDLEMTIKGMNGKQPYSKVAEMNILLTHITRDYNNPTVSIVENFDIVKPK